MKNKLISKTAILVAILVTLLSCLAIRSTTAKYYSEYNGEASGDTAKFIVDILYDENNNNLSITPNSSTLTYTPIEFVVSNTQNSNTSEVNQMYVIAMLFTKELLEVSAQFEAYDAYFLPVLFCTNDMQTESFAEIFQYVDNGQIPEGVSYALFQNFTIIFPEEGDYTLEDVGEDEVFPATWLYDSNNDEIYGDLSELMPEQQDGAPVVFSFDKNIQKSIRFFLVFVAVGELPAGKTINLNGIELIIYTEQTT